MDLEYQCLVIESILLLRKELIYVNEDGGGVVNGAIDEYMMKIKENNDVWGGMER